MKKAILILIMSLFYIFFITMPTFAEKPGATASDFSLYDIHGKKIRLSEFKGKVILLNFWATWCGPCRAEMPALNRLYLELKDKGFIIIAVSTDSSERPVKDFVGDKKIAFPVLMDKNKEVSFDLYGVFGLPTTFLIDRKGMIKEKILGEMEWDSLEMKKNILRLLEEKKI